MSAHLLTRLNGEHDKDQQQRQHHVACGATRYIYQLTPGGRGRASKTCELERCHAMRRADKSR